MASIANESVTGATDNEIANGGNGVTFLSNNENNGITNKIKDFINTPSWHIQNSPSINEVLLSIIIINIILFYSIFYLL